MRCLVCGFSDLIRIASVNDIPCSAQPFIDTKPPSHQYSTYRTSLTAFQCPSCSHVQSSAPLVSYYKDVISAASLSPSLLADRDSKIQELCSLLGKTSPYIYEIGAFKGLYIYHLQKLGYKNVRGIEHNSDSVLSAFAQGIKLDRGYLLDDCADLFHDVRYDIVLCFNFIEHIPDPFEFILAIKSKIASDSAYFYFTMPSFEYISSQNLLQEFVPDHISYFTPQSLRILFRRCNLKIHSLRSINQGNDLEIIARHDKVIISPLSDLPLQNLIVDINSVLLHDNKSKVFWGAGHRSLTLISQIEHSAISYIVDSAPFKQGMFCPDTGLKVVSPQFFFQDPPDVLFLSLPGLYAAEVIESIRSANITTSQLFLIEGNTLSSINI